MGMRKKKSSPYSMGKWVRPWNLRYFSLDFDGRVFFYSYRQETAVPATKPIPFEGIVGASMEEPAPGPDDARGGVRGKAESRFVVKFLGGRQMSLKAQSKGEAQKWVEALNFASKQKCESDGVDPNSPPPVVSASQLSTGSCGPSLSAKLTPRLRTPSSDVFKYLAALGDGPSIEGDSDSDVENSEDVEAASQSTHAETDSKLESGDEDRDAF